MMRKKGIKENTFCNQSMEVTQNQKTNEEIIQVCISNWNHKKGCITHFLFSNCSFSQEVDRLISYTKNKDDFKYNIIDTLRYEGATLFRIMMQSGKWLTKNEVDEPFWKHWVDIVVPDTLDTNTLLLFIGWNKK